MDQGKIPSEIKALLTGDEQKVPAATAKSSKGSKSTAAGGGGSSQG